MTLVKYLPTRVIIGNITDEDVENVTEMRGHS